MATTMQHHLPHVSLFTDHENRCVKILIAGEHGTLGLEAYAEDPCIALPDPDRGPEQEEITNQGEPRAPLFHRSMFLYFSRTGNICSLSHDKKER